MLLKIGILLLFISFTLLSFCHGIESNADVELQSYMDEKLTEFKLELQNDFHRQRIDRASEIGTPHRSVVLETEGTIDIGFPNPLNVIEFETVHNSQSIFIIAIYNDGSVQVRKADKNDPENLEEFFTLDNLGGPVFKVTAIRYTEDYVFMVFTVRLSSDSFRHHVYRFTSTVYELEHTIDCEGQTIGSIRLGVSNGHMFLLVGISSDLNRGTEESYLDIYHWHEQHFDPVSNVHNNPIKTSGVYDIAIWDYYGLLRFAVLQSKLTKFGVSTGTSRVDIYSIPPNSKRAYHGSHFTVKLDQTIPLDFLSYRFAYYFNGVQNLVLSSLQPQNSFTVFSTLAKSNHFVLNNLQNPFTNFDSTIVLPIPHGYPDDLIGFYSNSEQAFYIYNQDIRLRFHENFVGNSLPSLQDAKALLLSQEGGVSRVLLLFAYKLFPTPDYAYVIKIGTEPLNKTSDVLVECLKETEDLLEERWPDIKYLKKNIENVFVTDRSQNVTTTLVITGTINVSTLLNVHSLFIVQPDTDVPNITNSQLLKEILKTQHEVKKTEEETDEVVFKSINQTINGTTTIIKDLVAINVKINNISNNVLINNVKISRLIENTLKIVGNQTIHNNLSVKNLTVLDNLEVDQHLNGKSIDDLILTNATQLINGSYIFKAQTTFDNLTVYEINGVVPEYLVLTTGFQTIDGLKVFNVLNTTNINVHSVTNGRDLSEFASRVVTLTENHTITGNFVFENLYVDGNIQLEGLISNEVNITDLAEHVVTINTEQEINGFVTFLEKIHIAGDLETDHINGIKSEELVTLNTIQNLTGNITFENNVDILGELKVEFINGISTDDWVRRTEDYNITSHKTFNGSIHIAGDIIMDDGITIDDVDPSELNNSIAPREGIIDIKAPITFEELIVDGDVFIEDLVNDFNITEIENLFWRKSVFQHIPVSVLMPSNVHFKGNLTSKEGVNHRNLSTDYIHTTGNETIEGHVQFKDDVHVSTDIGVENLTTINGYDISFLQKYSVKLTGSHQVIEGPVYFASINVSNADVVVNGTVNDVDIDKDLLDLITKQNITTNIKFYSNTTVIKNLETKIIHVKEGGTVNMVELKKFVKNVVTLNSTSERKISGKTFNHIKVDNLTIDGSVDQKNFTDFLKNVVTLSTNQDVGGKKIFTGHLKFEGDLKVNILNGVEFTPYIQSVINRTQQTVVTGNKSIDGSVTVEGNVIIEPHKLVNEIDISKFAERTMVSDKLQNVTGFIWFNSSTVFIQNLSVIHATIDGVDPNKVALITEDTVLTGYINFNNSLVVNETILVKGLVHGCDLYDIYTNAVRLHDLDEQSINGSKVVSNLVVEAGDVVLRPNKTVNEYDLSELAEGIITTNGTQNVTGEIRFNTLYVNDLIINNLLNQKNLTELFEDAVYVDVNQTIEATKEFIQDVHFWNVLVRGNVSVEEDVNGVDIDDLVDNTVLRDVNTTVRGKKIFTNFIAKEINLKGLVNGINVTEDLWLLPTNDTLPAHTTLVGETVIDGNLKVHGLIDGKNLSDIIERRMTLTTNQSVESRLTFTNKVIIQGDCHISGTLNEIDPEDIVKTFGNFTIEGFKYFKNVTVIGNVGVDLINEVDIDELSENVVRRNSSTVIQGSTIFEETVEFLHNINVNGTVDGFDISHEAEKFRNLQDLVYKEIEDLSETQYNQTQDKHYLLDEIKGQTVVPSHFQKDEWKATDLHNIYPSDFNADPNQNYENPSTFYGYTVGDNCPSSCPKCFVTCRYSIEGSKIEQNFCSTVRLLRFTHNGTMMTLAMQKDVPSETCPGEVIRHHLIFGNGIADRVYLPLVTDVALLTPSTGIIFVFASPSNGLAEYPVSIYQMNPAPDEKLNERDPLEDSKGVKLVESFVGEIDGNTVYFIAAAKKRLMILYYYEENSDSFTLSHRTSIKGHPTGMLTLQYNNETLLVVSTEIIDPGFLYQESGPNLLLYKIKEGRLELVYEAFTGSIHHISVLKYAGDTIVVATQTDDDGIALFRLQGHALVDVGIKIPSISPLAAIASYYVEENQTSNFTDLPNYNFNEMYLHVLTEGRLSTMKSIQFGNQLNLETGLP